MQSARMRFIGKLAVATALLLSSANAWAQAPINLLKVGEESEITKSYTTSDQGSDGSTSSSSGHDTILERVIGAREGGVELEYDLSRDATAEDRARSWQFPTRVFRPPSGPMKLLNRAELETRVDGWLKTAGWSRAVCGRWIFTWNAFRIECDPQSVIETIEEYDLRFTKLREGATYRDTMARQPGALTRTATSPTGEIYRALMDVDSDVVRRSRAESDVAAGEIMRKPVTLDAALRERAKESISGTISVAFDADSAGNVWRRTKVTKLETRKPNGVLETSTATEIVTRGPVSGRKP